MSDKITFNSVLVPTDFSESAWAAFEHARTLVDGDDSEIVVLHAIDPTLINQIVQLGFGDHDSLLDSMKQNAKEHLQRYSDVSDKSTQIDTLACEGEPFFEIITKAQDFAVDAIVMNKLGNRHQPGSLFFGSTAEKVIRGSKKPVIVLPSG